VGGLAGRLPAWRGGEVDVESIHPPSDDWLRFTTPYAELPMPDPVFESAAGFAKRGCADFMVVEAGVVEAAAGETLWVSPFLL